MKFLKIIVKKTSSCQLPDTEINIDTLKLKFKVTHIIVFCTIICGPSFLHFTIYYRNDGVVFIRRRFPDVIIKPNSFIFYSL